MLLDIANWNYSYRLFDFHFLVIYLSKSEGLHIHRKLLISALKNKVEVVIRIHFGLYSQVNTDQQTQQELKHTCLMHVNNPHWFLWELKHIDVTLRNEWTLLVNCIAHAVML